MCTKSTLFLKYFLLLCFLSVIGLPAVYSTHNRAGEIHIQQIGPLTIRATIITWTKTSSFNVDRDSLVIDWGDGTTEKIARSNGNGVPLPNDVKYNTYVGVHTYSGQATYAISMTDQNRIAGIINVNPPSSDFVPFHIATTYTFQSTQFGGENTTPYLLQPPVDNACVGKPFKHNPNAFDPDGDSLSYQLIVPLQGPGEQVPNYSYPSQIVPGGNNILQLNPVTGDLIWLSPQAPGEYNIAIAIISWRGGSPIDTTIRDMQVNVDQCQNNPPIVIAPDEFCVVAGQTISFNVQATDPDSLDWVRLTALGGPFNTPFSPATFSTPANWQKPPVEGTFMWTTSCEHISDQPYSVVFKATDSVNVQFPRLSDLRSVSIKVVGPAPEDVQATANGESVTISWEHPYSCEDAQNDNFYGFSVWRKEGSNPFPLDTCDPGLTGKGYTQLVFVTKTLENGRFVFKDNNVQRGRTYCYRVEAKFARISGAGFPYNIVEGLPSEEVCVQLPRDVPIITQVSVESTSISDGSIQVCWTKPLATDLDTLLNPGPYRYQLLRASGLTNGALQEVAGASFIAPSFWLANDTCFTDTNLNTTENAYHYQVAFYVNGNATATGTTNEASSCFLEITSTDRKNLLSWTAVVPWGNYEYEVFRLNENNNQFEPIDTVITTSFEDKNLENGKEYCYAIRCLGSYGVNGIQAPLLNWSQEACGIPLDTVPPCAPTLLVSNRCTTGDPIELPDPPFENILTWTLPESNCLESKDLAQFKIWYSKNLDNAPEVVTTLNDAEARLFLHTLEEGLAGCYAISALDSVGNESPLSNLHCVDNCPEYELPNTFTPNNDGQNDLFTPFPGWRFVEKIDFQVFNRWGNQIFQTTDPAINWNGTTSDGKKVADGTYFYTCTIYPSGLNATNTLPTTRSGWIEVLGN